MYLFKNSERFFIFKPVFSIEVNRETDKQLRILFLWHPLQ